MHNEIMLKVLLSSCLLVCYLPRSTAWLSLPVHVINVRTHANTLLIRSTKQSSNDSEKESSSSSPSSISSELRNEQAPNAPSPSPSPTSLPARDLSMNELMVAMGTSPRRILLSTVSATSIALAGNFLGVTSSLLETVPESTVEATGLDTYYPRGDVKRIRGKGYTLTIPKEWVADTGLELIKAQRQARSLDYSSNKQSNRAGTGASTLPDAAFGPPGRLNARGASEGDTNVSVIVTSGMKGFSLSGTLGSPSSAADTLLRVSLAPEGSGRVATLLEACQDDARKVYQFEYAVDRGERGVPLRAISVIAEQNGDTLLTMTVVAPKKDWDDAANESKLRRVATSFNTRV